MVGEASSFLQWEVVHDICFDEELPDQYDEHVGTITDNAKETVDKASHPKRTNTLQRAAKSEGGPAVSRPFEHRQYL